MGKLVFVIGVVIAAVGLLMHFGVPFGRLPGDIVIRRGNFTFALPIVTSVVLSLILTLLFWLFRR